MEPNPGRKLRLPPSLESQRRLLRAVLAMNTTDFTPVQIVHATNNTIRYAQINDGCKWMVQEGYLAVVRRRPSSEHATKHNIYRFTVKGVEYAGNLLMGKKG